MYIFLYNIFFGIVYIFYVILCIIFYFFRVLSKHLYTSYDIFIRNVQLLLDDVFIMEECGLFFDDGGGLSFVSF